MSLLIFLTMRLVITVNVAHITIIIFPSLRFIGTSPWKPATLSPHRCNDICQSLIIKQLRKQALLCSIKLGSIPRGILRNNRRLSHHISQPHTNILWKLVDSKMESALLLNPNTVSSFIDNRLQTQHWLILTLFGFLLWSVENVTTTMTKLPKSEFAHL